MEPNSAVLPPDFDAVAGGFSAKAQEYDRLAESHPVVRWVRDRVHAMVERELGPPPASILEVNAGSGIDALYFAAKGYRVHATDIAPGMLDALAVKAASQEAGGRLTFEKLSFTELGSHSGGPYDFVFSNLGGLNCIPDLSAFASGLPNVLKSSGSVGCAIMPPVCPWELAQVLRGHRRTAFRRFRSGAPANVEAFQISVWYHGAGALQKALGPAFRTVTLRSLCFFCPPPFFHGLAHRRPWLIRILARMDDALCGSPPFNRAGDFYFLVSRYVDG